MSDIEGLYPPAQYGWGWLLLAFGVIALVILAGIVVLWATRPRYKLTKETIAAAPDVNGDLITAALRAEYLERLRVVEQAYTAGDIDAREANRRLSREVRSFVQDYSGFEAPVLGLNDLIELGVHPALIDAMQRHYYPSIFRSDMIIDPIAGVAAGRQVVTSWY
ncbi:hypothetical protein G7068_07695 [Leucobacter viscericola]|uniref:Uncharacterized protein n=1 Tax=Leucobacter viscericola TaxID=2714935 RepID=A0A6G7XES5_9MICO|nr:hypothetical protein [Leucobacter viscericola]QIK63094.1 hypothetical protein G7068_07695 [Leucobacter viscericola]